MASTTSAALPVLEVHTPQSSFAVVHSCTACYRSLLTETDPGTFTVQADTLRNLFTKLQKKSGEESIGFVVGAGWVKYEWNGSFWDLDDGRSDIQRFCFFRIRKLKHGNT